MTVSEHSDNSAMGLEQFLDWTRDNDVKCNTSKCKELIFRKNDNATEYDVKHNINQFK